MADYPTPPGLNAAPAPVDFMGPGQAISKSVSDIGGGLGQILQGYDQVEKTLDKNKLKAQAWAELQKEAPHVLKYADPNSMTFEQMARGLHQIAVARSLYQTTKQANPAVTLPDLKVVDQLAFPADEENFAKIEGLFTDLMGKGDVKRERAAAAAPLYEAATEGPYATAEEANLAAMKKKFPGGADPQVMKLYENIAVKGSVVASQRAKELDRDLKLKIAKIKAAAADKSKPGEEAKVRIQAENVNKSYAQEVAHVDQRVADNNAKIVSMKKLSDTAEKSIRMASMVLTDPKASENAKSTAQSQYSQASADIKENQAQIQKALEFNEQLQADKTYITDQQTKFISDMLHDFEIDMVTPAHEEANPEIRKGILDYGRKPAAPGAGKPAPAPTGAPGGKKSLKDIING